MNRVSLGAQSFQPRLLEVLERRASPDDVRGAVRTLRDAGFDNVSLDLVYGIPGQSPADLDARPRRGACARARAPLLLRARGEAGDALHARARRRARAPGRRDGGLLRAGGRHADGAPATAGTRRRTSASSPDGASADLRARHNLGYWLGRDYLGIGIGAVSTVAGMRRRNLPSLAALRRARSRPASRRRASSSRSTPRRDARERLLLGLRLDEPRRRSPTSSATPSTTTALARLAERGLVELTANGRGAELRLTPTAGASSAAASRRAHGLSRGQACSGRPGYHRRCGCS